MKEGTNLLFSTPVLHRRLLDGLESDRVVGVLRRMERLDGEGVWKSNALSWHSRNFQEDPQLRWLMERLAGCVSDWLVGFGMKVGSVKVTSAWGMHCPPGGYNAGHCHPGCDWSAVVHLTTVADGTSRLVLNDPRIQRSMVSDVFVKGCRPEWAYKRMKVRPRKGWVCVFPSWLWHETEASTTDRFAVASNLKVRK